MLQEKQQSTSQTAKKNKKNIAKYDEKVIDIDNSLTTHQNHKNINKADPNQQEYIERFHI